MFAAFFFCAKKRNSSVRFQVLTAASMKFRFVFWDVLPCKIIVDRRFRDTCCLHNQTENMGQEFQRELQDIVFIRYLTCLADLTFLLNIMNLKLQGKWENISHLAGHIEIFRKN
jgi:hypothetical protein